MWSLGGGPRHEAIRPSFWLLKRPPIMEPSTINDKVHSSDHWSIETKMSLRLAIKHRLKRVPRGRDSRTAGQEMGINKSAQIPDCYYSAHASAYQSRELLRDRHRGDESRAQGLDAQPLSSTNLLDEDVALRDQSSSPAPAPWLSTSKQREMGTGR